MSFTFAVTSNMRSSVGARTLFSVALLSALPVGVLGGDILSTTGFSTCLNDPTVNVEKLNVRYDRSTRILDFDVAGSSSEAQMVAAKMVVSAYGKQVYTRSFDPCAEGMAMMCPIPAGNFASHGEQTLPEEYAKQIPAIAFSIPDLDGDVRLELFHVNSTVDIACIQSTVGNGNTLNTPVVTYVAAGIAAAALALSALSAVAAGAHPGASTTSPTFGEVIGWFQGLAMNGMMSVKYPQVYQSFTTNFAFSTGLVPWGSMQTAIDNFRVKTGGNLTTDNYQYLKNNATLVYADGSNSNTKRAVKAVLLWARDGTEVSVNGSSTSVGGSNAANSTSLPGASSKEMHLVSGIQAYAEQLRIPQANTFMTVLLVWAIVVAAIIVAILLLKMILELWSMFGRIPDSLESWRKRYWMRLAKALTNLILLLYGIWTMYCIYQFTNGDSWAAKTLAGVTLALFTAVLIFFTWRIYTKASQYKKMDGDAGKLYEDKETWLKYNLFYENYKKGFWWLFVPAIVYMFARGAIIAGANGHALVQTIGQLAVEACMLAVLLWSRPFQRRSGNWINIIIQVVRVLSVICILVFVDELGLGQTTKTVTGIVLIVVQCSLTGVLAILIALNAIITCIKENPHRKQRKLAEKRGNRDVDDLSALDARNSLLMEPTSQKGFDTAYKGPMSSAAPYSLSNGRYDPVRSQSPAVSSERSFSRPSRPDRDVDNENLLSRAASMGRRNERSASPAFGRDESVERQPKLPNVGYGSAY